ncbi:phospholipase D-like domain-containing protein [Raineyella fluvialis]|uniref:phospholipase D-like domain-containing protein n=1 Tax=Raineyella fluvialis TaxID=2662261 RepID=UPI001E4C3B39|nr:phospholipase D-like domain-containing protein [Raineyella fluvialis]
MYRTRPLNGKPVRNHAKFVAVDHQFLIVTSANFSMSAEQNNVELGLRVYSTALTQMVEDQLWDAESSLYERVQ